MSIFGGYPYPTRGRHNEAEPPHAETTPAPLVLSELTLTAIQAEATRAHLRHRQQSMLGPHRTNGDRLAILVEEVGEVARELTYDHGGPHGRRAELVKELIQVAAMAASWVEYLESRSCPPVV